MNIVRVFICSLVLCGILNLVIFSFPEEFKKTTAKKKINLLLIISTCAYIVILICLIFIDAFCNDYLIELKISLLIIPLFSIVLFVTNIYYPSMRLYINAKKDSETIAFNLYKLIIKYRFESSDDRESTIAALKKFILQYKTYFQNSQMGIALNTLIEQSTSITNKAPEKLIDVLEKECLRTIDEMSGQSNPFSNVNLLTSFSLSALLTILIAFISL